MAEINYLDLLTKRAESKRRVQKKAPVCLSPELYEPRDEALTDLKAAEKELQDAKREAPPTPAQRSSAVKMNELPRVRKAQKAVDAARKVLDEAEDAVREVSIYLVLEGKTQEEIEQNDKTEIVAASFLRAETLDGTVIPEINKSNLVGLLPQLTSGEMAVIYNTITAASSAPDFPTSRRL